MKKTIAIFLSLLLICSLFAGCGSSSAKSDSAWYDNGMATSEVSYAPQAPAAAAGGYDEEGYYEEGFYEDSDYAVSNGSASAVDTAVDTTAKINDAAEKIIYTGYVYLETTDFDNSIATIEAMVKELGGYIQSSNCYGSTRYNSDGTTSVVDRTAYYYIAIPSQHFENALSRSGSIGNVTNQNRNAENITSQYTDVASRVESLQVQEDRLLEMMKATDDIESLILLEERLSEVTYEKEYFQRTLNNYDRQVAYSTINYNVSEVEVYTPVVPVRRSFGQKLADAFSDGWTSFVWGLEDFVLWFAESIIGIAIFAGFVVLIVVLVKRCIRKSRAKKAAAQAAQTPAQPTVQE